MFYLGLATGLAISLGAFFYFRRKTLKAAAETNAAWSQQGKASQ